MENTLIRDGFSHLRAFNSRLLGVSLPLLHPEEPSTAAPAKAIAPIIKPAHGVVEIPEMTVATGF